MATIEPYDDVVKDFLRRKLDLIKREYSPSRLVVFGSRTKGRATSESDVDLIVVSERFRGVRFPNRMGEFLNTVWPDLALDAICYTPEEFEEMLRKPAPFVRNAVANGVHII